MFVAQLKNGPDFWLFRGKVEVVQKKIHHTILQSYPLDLANIKLFACILVQFSPSFGLPQVKNSSHLTTRKLHLATFLSNSMQP
jgi:hypothetical protein